MSYCRWSTDDFSCDLYCYQSSHGYVTHVACSRHDIKGSLPTAVSFAEDVEAWMARHVAVMDAVEAAELVKIGLPMDGETFVDPTASAMLGRLLDLREMGYIVPDSAIETLEQEIADEGGAANG